MAHDRWSEQDIPKDIRVESLTADQNRELNRLKEWLYQKRTQAKQEQGRVERREKKEAEAPQEATQGIVRGKVLH